MISTIASAAEPASSLRERAAASRTGAPRHETPEAFVKFEAMVLQTFMQSILPSDSESVYGGGMAGDMWKSMLAQQLGEVMAKRGGIGIAHRVLGDHYRQGEDRIPIAGASQGSVKEEAGHQDLLSTARVEKMQREIGATISQDLSAAAVKPEH